MAKKREPYRTQIRSVECFIKGKNGQMDVLLRVKTEKWTFFDTMRSALFVKSLKTALFLER